MTATTDRRRERIPALCCGCGTARDVARGYAGSNAVITLRCATCNQTTSHAPVRGGEDYREAWNRKTDGAVKGALRDKAHMESLGIVVTMGKPEGGICDIRHYLGEGGPRWRVVVNWELELDEQARALQWAWKTMLPSTVNDYAHSWEGAVCEDEYGEFRGCFRDQAGRR